MTGRGPQQSWRSPARRAAAVLAVAVALAVVAAAVGEPADREDAFSGVALPASALILGVDVLIGAFVAAAGVLGALVAWALLTGGRASGRSWPRERVLVVTVALLAAAFGLVWAMEQSDLEERLAGFAERFDDEIEDELEGLRLLTGEGEDVDRGARGFAVAAGAAVMLAGAAAWWWWLRDPAEGDSGGDDDGAVTARLADAVEAALTDVDEEPDPRQAILRCYARLDAALSAVGCPRQAAETAREHRQRAADALGPGAQSAARLVERFERARYDAAPITDGDRREAVEALYETRAALGQPWPEGTHDAAALARATDPPEGPR